MIYEDRKNRIFEEDSEDTILTINELCNKLVAKCFKLTVEMEEMRDALEFEARVAEKLANFAWKATYVDEDTDYRYRKFYNDDYFYDPLGDDEETLIAKGLLPDSNHFIYASANERLYSARIAVEEEMGEV